MKKTILIKQLLLWITIFIIPLQVVFSLKNGDKAYVGFELSPKKRKLAK